MDVPPIVPAERVSDAVAQLRCSQEESWPGERMLVLEDMFRSQKTASNRMENDVGRELRALADGAESKFEVVCIVKDRRPFPAQRSATWGSFLTQTHAKPKAARNGRYGPLHNEIKIYLMKTTSMHKILEQ